MLDVLLAVQTETIQHVQALVLHDVEIAVVAVTRNDITILAIPFGVLHTYVLCRDHLAVEHHIFRAVLFVLLLDDAEQLLHEMRILRRIFDLQTEELGSLYQTVHTDRQILTADIDVAGVEQRQHAFRLQGLEVLVVCQLHFVHQVNDILYICLVRDVVTYGVLDGAVQVDRQHGFRTRRDTAGAEGVAETVVRDRVTQTAAAREAVRVVAHVGEERVTLRVHLCREIAVLLVFDIAILRQQRHRLYREREYRAGTLFVEPVHESLLQPVQAVPVRSLAVRETEVLKQALEIVAVVVADVPEYRLEITGTARLVQTVNNLLEAVADHAVNRAAFQTQIDYLVRALVVILAVLLLDEVIHIHKELGRSARA